MKLKHFWETESHSRQSIWSCLVIRNQDRTRI